MNSDQVVISKNFALLVILELSVGGTIILHMPFLYLAINYLLGLLSWCGFPFFFV
jgi:hypothetical protein